MKAVLLCTLALEVLLAATAMAQGWLETGDAGDLPATAQVPIGNGPLTSITGTLSSPMDVDCYVIIILWPWPWPPPPPPTCGTNCRATTCGGAIFDTQLFLFNHTTGLGVTHNDDDPEGCGVQSTITRQFVPEGVLGEYMIAISGFNRDPVDSAGARIWLNSPFNVERQPDGPGAANPIAGWTGYGGADTYIIRIPAGAFFVGTVDVEPTTWGSIKSMYRN